MKKITAILCGVACAIIMLISPFLSNVKSKSLGEGQVILTIWQVDSFEGGSGSRTTFLRNRLASYAKKNANLSILVTSHTPTSANTLLKSGSYPDIISYGPCSVELQGYAKEIPFKAVYGGTANGKAFAVPFLCGGYFVIEKGENAQKAIISTSEYTTPEVACLFSGRTFKEYLFLSKNDALALFLRSKSAVMIGTQRDVVRLIDRSEEFVATPILEYCDLYQYLSITSDKNEATSLEVIEYLLSEKVQAKLPEINMLSPSLKGLYSNNQAFYMLEGNFPSYTQSAFSTMEHLGLVKQKATEQLLLSGNASNILKYLKQL